MVVFCNEDCAFTNVYVAGVDIVVLAVFSPTQCFQFHSVVVICARGLIERPLCIH